jgi:hypothetical protein
MPEFERPPLDEAASFGRRTADAGDTNFKQAR